MEVLTVEELMVKCLPPVVGCRMVTGRDKPEASRVSEDDSVTVDCSCSTAPAVVKAMPASHAPAVRHGRVKDPRVSTQALGWRRTASWRFKHTLPTHL